MSPLASGPPPGDHVSPILRALAPVHDIAFRGSPVEAWIKARRDRYPVTSPGWFVLDELLDDWRERADTGTFLSTVDDEWSTWRHEDGSVRIDHMDSRPGDYHGPPPLLRGPVEVAEFTDEEMEQMPRVRLVPWEDKRCKEWNPFGRGRCDRVADHDGLHTVHDEEFPGSVRAWGRRREIGWGKPDAGS